MLSLALASGTAVDQSLPGLLYSPFFLHFTPLLPRAGGLLGGGVFVQNEGKDLEFKGLEKELNKGPGELSGNLG